MTTPADELRAAAAHLRRLTDRATEAPWSTKWNGQQHQLVGPSRVYPITEWSYAIVTTQPKASEQRAECDTADADYIAAMHPGVGTALADWLEAEAAIWDAVETVSAELGPRGLKVTTPLSTHAQALAVARAINAGGQS